MKICKNCHGIGGHHKWCESRQQPRRTHEAACTGRHCAECTPVSKESAA